MDYRALLPLCETDSQRAKVEACIEHGSLRKAAHALGLSKNAIRQTVQSLKQRYMASPTAMIAVHGTSTLYDSDGKMKLQWIKTGKESRKFDEIRAIVREMAQEDAKPVKIDGKPHSRDSSFPFIRWVIRTLACMPGTLKQVKISIVTRLKRYIPRQSLH